MRHHIASYILGLAALLVVGCAQDPIRHPEAADAPSTASVYDPLVSVDQETNQVTFTLGEKALVPVWVFQDRDGEWTEYHTSDGYKKIFASAGDYTVRMYVMNAAGTSPDYVAKTFHIDNTLVNFDRYIRYLSGGDERTWRIDGSVAGHMACGESIASPANWWSASVDEKKDSGVYDNRLTFSATGTYTFDPGTSGTVYVNKDVTAAQYTAYKGDATEDYTVPVEKAEASYSFTVEGDDVYLVLPAGTLFPYIPNDAFISDTRFVVSSIDNNTLTLVTWEGGIAWQFILTSKAAAYVFNGYDYAAGSNIWRPADAADAHTYAYYYAPGWAPIADPVPTLSNGAYTLELPEATSEQWQAQFFIIPVEDIALSADTGYDFSVIVNSSKAIPQMTFKLTDTSDDGNFLFAERRDIPANEDYIFYLTGLSGIDADAIKMVFDFGGNEAGTEVTVSRITLKDHAVDDGTILPEDGPEGPTDGPEEYDYANAANLWRPADAEGGATVTYYYAPGWAPIADPVMVHTGAEYGWTLPEATSAQWQAQVFLVPTAAISLNAASTYDFSCVLSSSEDIANVTVKIHRMDDGYTDDENNAVALFTANVPVKAGEDYVLDLSDQAGIDAGTIRLVLDFGGNPAGAEVGIRNITLKDHTVDDGTHKGGSGGGVVTFDYDAAGNLWKPADAAHTYSVFFAPNWQEQPGPAIAQEGNAYSFNLPEATSAQWQAQVFIIPDEPIVLTADKTYDFHCIVTASADISNVTFKLPDNDDDGNFLFTERRDITADEPYVFTMVGVTGIDAAAGVKMVFDFGGNPADTDIEVKEIILQEHVADIVVPDDPDTKEDYTTNDASISSGIYDIEGDGNLWRSATIGMTYWYSPADWSGGLTPYVFRLADNGLKVIVPEGIGGSEWQGQNVFHTDIPVTAGTSYDFCVKVNTDTDISSMTFKLAWDGNDEEHEMVYVDDADKQAAVHDAKLKAGTTYTFKLAGITPDVDYDKLVLFIDLGRCKEATAVSFTDFCFQESADIDIPDGYKLVWRDEFETDGKVASANWKFENWPKGYVNDELQRYVAGGELDGNKTAYVADGVLNIVCMKYGNEIISARMNSTESWKYGYMEASIRLPKGKGTWPAFWMMPDDQSDGWPRCGEIDIMEEVGADPDITSSSIHTWDYNHTKNTQKTHSQTTAGAEDGFHVYACEWTEDRIRFYVDGKQHLQFDNDGAGNKDTWPFDKPFYVTLNLAWGGSWGGYKGVDESALPATMQVDYVRVFQKK